jgi:hypothetical protein
MAEREALSGVASERQPSEEQRRELEGLRVRDSDCFKAPPADVVAAERRARVTEASVAEMKQQWRQPKAV